jgi:uncharacterized low-complexity protein
MSKTFSKKPLALALGAAFTLTGLGAQASVFAATDLTSGYMVAQATPATPATPAKPAEGKCGEGKCGAACMKKMKDKGKSEADAKTHCDKMKAEGKCGEGKCGGDKKKDKAGEGKCGEGKCGGHN